MTSKEAYDLVVSELRNLISATEIEEGNIYEPHRISDAQHNQCDIVAVITYETLSSARASIGEPALYNHVIRLGITIDTNIKQPEVDRTKSLELGDSILQSVRNSSQWGSLSLVDSALDEVNYNAAGRIRYAVRIYADFSYYTRSDEE